MSLDTIEDIAEVHGIALDLDDFHKLISQEKVFPLNNNAIFLCGLQW